MTSNFQTPVAPVSWGELIDKITILEIKKQNIPSPAAQANIDKEWSYLTGIVQQNSGLSELVHLLQISLKDVNSKLWRVEDHIREKESLQEFDSDFVNLARSVYQLNDHRALLKKQINELLNSELTEEKSYNK